MRYNNTVLDIDKLQRLSGQLGSNPAGIYSDISGQRYYIKTLESLAHARNEFIAAQLYQLAGVPTLQYLQTNQTDQVATQWVTLDKKCVKHLSETERKQAQHWFGVHAWTANWDVAGYNGDNQGVYNNTVITLDVGGALNFRAMGDPKGKQFGTTVNELSLLRSDSNNPHAVKMFADMSKKTLQHAIDLVVTIPDQQIREVILDNKGHPKLVAKMIARKAYMAQLSKA